MIMQLVRGETPVLTATSKHTINDAGHFFPISYEGDLSLFPDAWDEGSVDLLEGMLSRIAREHGLKMDGDYHHMINNIELVWDEKDNL